MPTSYSVTSASVPAGLSCVITDAKWQELVALLSVLLPDGVKIIVDDSEPGPSDRDAIWYRLNGDGTPDRIYIYANGSWMSKHPVATGAIIMYRGTEASIDTFDGGSAGVITPTTGPFWAKVTELNARFPLGIGTLPISSTVVAVGNTGGIEKHTLTVGEMPSHAHDVESVVLNASGNEIASGNSYRVGTRVSEEKGGDAAHQNMPPYLGVLFLERTARIFHTAP